MAEYGIVEKLAPLIPPPPQQQQQLQPQQQQSQSKKAVAVAMSVGVGSSEEEAQFLAIVHQEPDLTNIILRLLFNLSFDLVLRLVHETRNTHFTTLSIYDALFVWRYK